MKGLFAYLVDVDFKCIFICFLEVWVFGFYLVEEAENFSKGLGLVVCYFALVSIFECVTYLF